MWSFMSRMVSHMPHLAKIKEFKNNFSVQIQRNLKDFFKEFKGFLKECWVQYRYNFI